MIPALRELVRAARPQQPQSVKDIEARLASERTQIEAERAALTAAEHEVARLTLAGAAPADQTAAHERREAAEVAISRREATLRFLEEMLAQAQEAAEAKRYRDAVAKADRLLEERAEVGAKLEELLGAMAETMLRVHALNVQILEAVPHKPRDRPAMFNLATLHNALALRLFALTGGAMRLANVGVHTPGTAAELPSLDKRLQAERKHLLSQYQAPRSEAA